MPIIQSPLKLKIVNSCALNGMKTYMNYSHVYPMAYPARKQGHISVAHLEDLYLQGQTYEHCVTNVIDTIVLFDKLGLVVHSEKSCFIPTQVLVILGLVINSVKMTIQLTTEKAVNYKKCLCWVTSNYLSNYKGLYGRDSNSNFWEQTFRLKW